MSESTNNALNQMKKNTTADMAGKVLVRTCGSPAAQPTCCDDSTVSHKLWLCLSLLSSGVWSLAELPSATMRIA